MKTTCYLRVARDPDASTGYRFGVTARANPATLSNPSGNAVPTIALKLVLDIPPGVFGALAEVNIAVPEDSPVIVADVEAV